MIALVKDGSSGKRPSIAEADRRWATRRLQAAVDAVLRRWPRGSERVLVALLIVLAERVARRRP